MAQRYGWKRLYQAATRAEARRTPPPGVRALGLPVIPREVPRQSAPWRSSFSALCELRALRSVYDAWGARDTGVRMQDPKPGDADWERYRMLLAAAHEMKMPMVRAKLLPLWAAVALWFEGKAARLEKKLPDDDEPATLRARIRVKSFRDQAAGIREKRRVLGSWSHVDRTPPGAS